MSSGLSLRHTANGVAYMPRARPLERVHIHHRTNTRAFGVGIVGFWQSHVRPMEAHLEDSGRGPGWNASCLCRERHHPSRSVRAMQIQCAATIDGRQRLMVACVS